MKLTNADIDKFDRDGILFFPSLLSEPEIEYGSHRASGTSSLKIVRRSFAKRTPATCAVPLPRIKYNASFERLMRHPSIVEPVKQLLGGDVYLHQFSINPKAAFEGESLGLASGLCDLARRKPDARASDHQCRRFS